MDSLGVLVPWWFTRFLNDEPDTRRKDRHAVRRRARRSEEHTSELQSPCNLVCRLLLEKKIRLSRIAVLGLILLPTDSLVRSTPPRNAQGSVSKPSLLSSGTPLRGFAVAVS